MTPDIKAIREANTGTDCSANIHPATVIALCDEVERLRKELESEKELRRIGDFAAQIEIRRLNGIIDALNAVDAE